MVILRSLVVALVLFTVTLWSQYILIAYALRQGRVVKTCLKTPFATFVFEAKKREDRL
jgi:hypothetical protein